MAQATEGGVPPPGAIDAEPLREGRRSWRERRLRWSEVVQALLEDAPGAVGRGGTTR